MQVKWISNVFSKISRRHVVLIIFMAVVIAVSVGFGLYIALVRGQHDNLEYSKAEPVLQNGSLVVFPFGGAADRKCPLRHFICKSNGMCIDLEKRCNGKVDCPQAEDEQNCVCAFRMPSAKFCDKYPDCFDESDEKYCSYCPDGAFNCGDGQCVSRDKVCDTKMDCQNLMDENFCFRLSTNVGIALADEFSNQSSYSNSDLLSKETTTLTRTGFLLRNKHGTWYPVCATPQDNMQDALASFACVSITANPLAGSSHYFRKFQHSLDSREYVYHYRGRFVQWQGCLTDSGIFVACDDVRCGLNPKQLLPKRPSGRIVGGHLSSPGAWPWHAAIYKNGTYSCGATLMNNRWLISAAHCFINHRSSYFEVTLGMLRRRSFTPHQKTYSVQSVVLHPKFSVVTLEYDIALLRTSEKVNFDFWVRPICLPDQRKVENSGSFCTAIGWGDTGETRDDSDDLQEVQVPLTKVCKKNMDRWLCAGFEVGGRDACQGDSGGPLMCLSQGGMSWYIAGVISGGTGCARPKTPGMYTRVVYFIDWIKQVIRHPVKEESRTMDVCPGWRCAVLGGGNCLQADRICDGHVDCYDADDETNCSNGRKT